MGNVNDKLAYIDGTKSAIKTAIEAKGVSVANDVFFRDYATKIGLINTVPYVEPSDWIDISTVANNEINLLVTNGIGIGFSVNTSSGTYSIDWGDGTIETGRTSGTVYQHQHLADIAISFQDAGDTVTKVSHGIVDGTKVSFPTIVDTTGISIHTQYFVINAAQDTFQLSLTLGGEAIALTTDGTGTMVIGGKYCSLGYYTWFVRIYGASGNITIWRIRRHNYSAKQQYMPFLNANFGTIGITDYGTAFYDNSGNFASCPQLKKCKIPTFASCYTASFMFSNCTSLEEVTLPSTWGAVTSVSSMFQSCTALSEINIPNSWGSITTVGSLFSGCYNLRNVTLPSSWGSITVTSSLFSSCYSLNRITLPVIWGSITTMANMFSSCYSLTNIILPSSWNAATTTITGLFINCYKLSSINLPDTWNNITTANSVFSGCYNLKGLILPNSWGSITNLTSFLQSCTTLNNITLPSSWAGVTTTQAMFSGCSSLNTITLPANFSTVMNSAVTTFSSCVSLKTIFNLEYFGNITTSVNMTDLATDTEYLQQNVSIGSLLTGFGLHGSVGLGGKLKVSSIRLTNLNSPFSGASPHINVTYTSMDAAAIELLFGDIPNGLFSKIISITGSTGCDTLVSKTSSGTISGSKVVTQANTTGLVAGMEVYGTGLSDARAVTLQFSADTVTRVAHGFENDMKISFTSIVTTAGITNNTTYYVINKTDDTFQLSLTLGGSVVNLLTADGSGTIIIIPTIVTVNTNTDIVLDVPAFTTGTITLTAGILKRSIALLKGWTVTN